MLKWVYFFLAFLFIAYPYSFYEIKLPILALILIASFVKIFVKGKIDFSRSTLVLFILYIVVSLFFIVYGVLIGNAHEKSLPFLAALYIAFPIIYFFILNIITKRYSLLIVIENIFIFCTIAIAVIMYLAVMNKRGLLSENWVFIVDPVNNVDVRTVKNVIKISYHGISSLVFLIPYLFGVLVLGYKGRSAFRSLLILLALSSGSYAVFISGRRALIIIFVLSVFATILFKLVSTYRIKIKKKFISYFFILLLVGVPFIDFNKLVTSVNSTLSFALNLNYHKDSKKSDDERILQSKAFLTNIIKKPILGYGHGAFMQEIERSKDKPWRYEISYLDIIYHVGFGGFILYALGPLWIILSLIKIIKYNVEDRSKAFSILVGFSCILLTYASNPYLNAFDIQWVIYFPILFINIINRKVLTV